TDYTIPVQDPHTNAGFGWRIQPGRLMDGVQAIFDPAYLSPDGGQHGLYTQLHPGYPGAGTQPDTWFTNDSTYLRMRLFPAAAGVCTAAPGSTSGDCYRIEFPDGEIHELHDFSAIPNKPDWRVTRITDVFAHDHYVEIDYSVADEWTVTDSHGRTQTIHFTGGVVSSVELSAFGGATATYTLVHTPTEIERQKYGPPDCVDGS
ncbi:MAG: hypothetical protein GY713_18020, partial [Actinomycetia bacterium]|nr:hypothetical protein [Actinomycetes bacterium]